MSKEAVRHVNMHTPAAIRAARSSKGLTLEKLARLARVSLPTVIRMERKARTRSTPEFLRVIKALGMEVSR